MSIVFYFSTKVSFLLFFLFIPFWGSSQSSIIDEIKAKQKGSATDLIIFIDSLLFYNNHLSTDEVAEIEYYQALAYQKNTNHKKGLEIFDKIAKDLKKNPRLYTAALLQQSNSNTYLKNYTEATTQAIEALDLAQQNNFKDLIASSNNALSFIHYANGDYLNALSFLQSSEKMQEQNKDSLVLSSTYNNIAIIHKNMGNYQMAQDYNEKSLVISVGLKDYLGIGKSYSNIGRLYEELGQYQKALKFYQKAIDNNLNHEIKNSIPYRNAGDILRKQGNTHQTEIRYLEALDIEEKNENQSAIQLIYADLLKNAISAQDFEKALTYNRKLDSIAKVNARHSNDEKTKMLMGQYKLHRNQQKLKQIQKINSKNKIIFGVLFGLALLAILFVSQAYKTRALKIEKEKLFLEQSVLRSQMNPHFIFNALSAIQNSLLDNEPLKSAAYLSRFAKLIRQNFDFINHKSISLQDELDALKNYLETQKLRFEDKFDYEFNIQDDVDIQQIEIPPLILQPFLENAIEHGFKNIQHKGLIIVNVSRKGRHICYEVLDNGMGYSTTKHDNKTHAIDIFKKRIKLLNPSNNTFSIHSSDKGTTIKFCIKE